MKRILIACLLGSVAFAAAAQDAVPVAADVDVQADVQAQVEAQATPTEQLVEQEPEAGVSEDAKRECIRYTGTHVRKTRDLGSEECVIASGTVYSREDLLRTGRTDLADALRALDPVVR